MTAYQITFYCIAAIILVTGFLSVITRKIFRSAIWLLLSLIGVAGLYFWMEVEFIAAVQMAVLLYSSYLLFFLRSNRVMKWPKRRLPATFLQFYLLCLE